MSNSVAVKRWRQATKRLMIDSLGGKCCICAYDRCQSSLEFHHITPGLKDFAISQVTARPTKWERIVPELRKCALVCRNCHGEIHHGVAKIPASAPRFNESYALRKIPEPMGVCPVCHGEMPARQKACSYKCAGDRKLKINWKVINLADLISKHTYQHIGEMLGCTDNSVIKRAKKLGIYVPQKVRAKSTGRVGVEPTIVSG